MKPLMSSILCLPLIATADDGFRWHSIGWNVYWPEEVKVAVPDDWSDAQRAAAVEAVEGVLRYRTFVNLTRPGQDERVGDRIIAGDAPVKVRLVSSSWPGWNIRIVVAPQGPDTRGRVVFTPGRKARIEIRPQDTWRPKDIQAVVRHECLHLKGLDHN